MTAQAAIAVPTADPKRARVLQGAMTVFLAYGFTRTTMDDIARAAEVSRPALYLLFKNKTDIYRALASDFRDEAVERARSALAGEGPLVERLARGMECAMQHIREVEDSPHGAEILDMKNSLAGDIIAAGRAAMGKLVEEAVAAEAKRSGVRLAEQGLSAEMLSDLLLDAIDGMKMRSLPREAQQLATVNYISLIGRLVSR
jgi:AcrR family transcriptional regulator